MQKTSIEIWNDIPKYEGQYQASTKGRVKSLDRLVQGRYGYRLVKGRVLKPTCYTKSGHLGVHLGARNHQSIHLLILVAFKGQRPQGLEGRHLDGDLSNNKLDNLEWGVRPKKSIKRNFNAKELYGV